MPRKISKKQVQEKTIKLMGRKPINPIGECFECSTRYLLDPKLNKDFLKLKNVRLCHGIGICNIPGQEGEKIAHGWIEFTTIEDNVDIVFDTTWGTLTKASLYRKRLKLKYVIEYTPKEALEN